MAEEFFNNGNEFSTTTTVSTSGVTNPAPEAVYQSVRCAPSFNYLIPGLASGSSYTVRCTLRSSASPRLDSGCSTGPRS